MAVETRTDWKFSHRDPVTCCRNCSCNYSYHKNDSDRWGISPEQTNCVSCRSSDRHLKPPSGWSFRTNHRFRLLLWSADPSVEWDTSCTEPVSLSNTFLSNSDWIECRYRGTSPRAVCRCDRRSWWATTPRLPYSEIRCNSSSRRRHRFPARPKIRSGWESRGLTCRWCSTSSSKSPFHL